MLSKSDCLSILVKLEDKGLDIDQYMKKLVISKEIPIEVLKFIIQNQGIEITNFYEMLRNKHNKNKSKLYINILKEEEATQDIITTLVCLLTQITLYSNKLGTTEKSQFLKEARAEEISRVLNKYYKEDSIEDCFKVLKLIKTDLLVIEALNDKRQIR